MPSSKKPAEVFDGTENRASKRALPKAIKMVAKGNAKAAPKADAEAQSERLARSAPQEASAYAPSVWGTQTQFEVTTPSGQVCLCRELTVERLIEMGLLQAISSLEGIVGNQVLPKAQGQPSVQVDMAELVQNADKLTAVLDLVNVIVCEAVVAPRVHVVPADGENRVDGLVYVDSIGMQDRFAIFAEVTGGLDSLSSFR